MRLSAFLFVTLLGGLWPRLEPSGGSGESCDSRGSARQGASKVPDQNILLQGCWDGVGSPMGRSTARRLLFATTLKMSFCRLELEPLGRLRNDHAA